MRREEKPYDIKKYFITKQYYTIFSNTLYLYISIMHFLFVLWGRHMYTGENKLFNNFTSYVTK